MLLYCPKNETNEVENFAENSLKLWPKYLDPTNAAGNIYISVAEIFHHH